MDVIDSIGETQTRPSTDDDMPLTIVEERLPKLTIGSPIPETRYQIVRWLGQGGMGVVFEVKHLDIDRRYAVKLLNVAKNPSRTRRFRDEARTISKLGSPYVVEVFDFKELSDGRLLYVMELVDGPSLFAVCQSEGPLAVGRLLGLARQICKGLHDAHNAEPPVIHRDIKPENIMLGIDERGREQVKLVDFGLAILLGDPRAAGTGGTPAYMSPEQCQGLAADPRTDIYAFGASLYELACGRLPFLGQTSDDVRAGHLNRQPDPPSRWMEGELPPGFDALILRCLSKRPDQRYASAAELEAALIELQLELQLSTPFDDLPAPALADTRRQRRLEEGLAALRNAGQRKERRRMIVGVALLVAVMFGAGLGLRVQSRTQDETAEAAARAVDKLRARAHEAASHARWFYPSRDSPETAYLVVLELEDSGLEGAQPAAEDLREEFAGTLVGLGDYYWDNPGGRTFAVDFYRQALFFDRHNDRAGERSAFSAAAYADLDHRARTGDFADAELNAAETISELAQANPEQRLAAVVQASRRNEYAGDRAALEELARSLSKEVEPQFAAALLKPIADDTDPLAPDGPPTPEEELDGETGGETGDEVEGETEGDVLEDLSASKTGNGKAAAKAAAKRGKQAYDRGEAKQAERLFHQALARDNRNLTALVGLHRVHFDRGNYREARDYAQRASKLRPKRGDLHIFVGDSCMKVLDYACARKHYKDAKARGNKQAAGRLKILDDRVGK